MKPFLNTPQNLTIILCCTKTFNFFLKPDLLKQLLDPHDAHHEGKNGFTNNVAI